MTTITNAMLAHYNQLAARAEAETLQDCIARADAAEAECERLRSLILQAYNAGQVNDGFMRLALNVDETTLSQGAAGG